MNESGLEGTRHNLPMQFYFGYHNVKVLFRGWEINSIGALLASVAGVFLFALLYEVLKSLRIMLYHNRGTLFTKAKCYLSIQYNKLYSSIEVKPREQSESPPTSAPVHMAVGVGIIQTLLYMLQITIGYFLMLIAMTYNAWLFIAIITGAGTGYICFGKLRMSQLSNSNNRQQ